MMHAPDVIEVINPLGSASVDVWVHGGWGIDALLGEQTRAHDDLDVIIRADDVKALIRVTRELCFAMMTDELPQVFVVSDAMDRRIDFHPVRFRSDGAAVQESNSGGEWVFSSPGLLGTGFIDGRKIRCLTRMNRRCGILINLGRRRTNPMRPTGGTCGCFEIDSG